MTCLLCGSLGWLSIHVETIPPGGDWWSSNTEYETCPLCAPNGDVPDEAWERDDHYHANADPLGGIFGAYTVFEVWPLGASPLSYFLVVDRSAHAEYWLDDATDELSACAVCNGFGVWAPYGEVKPCIACKGETPTGTRYARGVTSPWRIHTFDFGRDSDPDSPPWRELWVPYTDTSHA